MNHTPRPGDTVTVTYADGRSKAAILMAVDEHHDVTRYVREVCKVDIEPRIVTRWTLLEPDPKDRRDECRGYFWPDSDYATITAVNTELDLFDTAGVTL